ncbi:MAG: hypothetical protein QOD77_528 [Thermoplasmata archaeon]|jgi:ribosomal protein S18 acetylase RimI-like enzyme|nr:hypothetical protein [Thermoplasmata archaeon]
MLAVRDARPTDEDALLRSTLGNAFESEGIRLDEAVARRGVRALLADPGKGRALVAELDGQPVGSLYVTFEWSDWHAQWYWWIQSVYVVPERRGTGVYSALYRHLQGQARAAGNVRAVRLYVESNNENALRAYRGHGMQQAPYEVFEWVTR